MIEKEEGGLVIPGYGNGHEPLTIREIGARLGRELRFGRGVRCWWTVLHHTFVVETLCMDMLQDKRKSYRESVRIYALTHDGHESIWGDIPTPLKTDAIRAAQADFDRLLYVYLGIPEPPPLYKQIIKRADYRAMLAEGAIVGPCGWYDKIKAAQPGGKFDYEWSRHLRQDCEIVANIAETYPDCRSTFARTSPAVNEFVRTLEAALRGQTTEDEDEPLAA